MKLVILDRDGTINECSDDFVKTPGEWVPLPGALEAIARLNHHGFHVVVVSNQPGLGRGTFDMASLNAMHLKMHKLVAAAGGRIEAVFLCPHTPEDDCRCAMPQPGLFEQISERYGLSLKGVPVVGDRERDLQAGAALGCEPHLVLSGRGAEWRGRALPESFPAGTRVHADLPALVEYLIAREAARVPAPEA